MAVKVSFMKPRWAGAVGVMSYGQCRVAETVTVPGVTTAVTQDGEIMLVTSTEAAAVVIATGTTPDAAATAQTALTTAGMALEPLSTQVVYPNTGDKISIKAFV